MLRQARVGVVEAEPLRPGVQGKVGGSHRLFDVSLPRLVAA
jgi:hypothetical protein